MVAEPTQSGVSAFAAGLSAGALALFGVSYMGLLWALFGAVVSLMFTPAQSRGQALAAVVGGMLTGAALSDLFMAVAFDHVADVVASKIHIAFAFLIGAGAKQILGAVIAALIARIAKVGGSA